MGSKDQWIIGGPRHSDSLSLTSKAAIQEDRGDGAVQKSFYGPGLQVAGITPTHSPLHRP